MGLNGYLAARSDAEHYASERAREELEVREVLLSYGLTAEESAPIVQALSTRPGAWVDFMMRFELGLETPDPRRGLTSALTIAGAYIVGGFIPIGGLAAAAAFGIARAIS